MAETLTPLAPPQDMASRAVQPVTVPGQSFVPAAAQPVVVEKTITPTHWNTSLNPDRKSVV